MSGVRDVAMLYRCYHDGQDSRPDIGKGYAVATGEHLTILNHPPVFCVRALTLAA